MFFRNDSRFFRIDVISHDWDVATGTNRPPELTIRSSVRAYGSDGELDVDITLRSASEEKPPSTPEDWLRVLELAADALRRVCEK